MRVDASQWANLIRSSYARKHLVNYEAAVDLVNKTGIAERYKNATILDAYSGPGIWSAALNNVVQPQNHIIMDPYPQTFKHLAGLPSPENKLQVVQQDPFRWKTFTDLAQSGVYTPISHPRHEINPHILFTANLSQPQGEQLVTQYLNCILNRSWLQSFGRVRLLLWVRPSTAMKLMYPIGHSSRSRVTIQADATTDIKLISSDEQEPDERAMRLLNKRDFFPHRVEPPWLLQIDPKQEMPKYLNSFEYVTKMLMIQRTKPLQEAIMTLGAGAAEDLGPQLTDLYDLTPRNMTLEQINQVVTAFEWWPFKPEILHDFYEQDFQTGGSQFSM